MSILVIVESPTKARTISKFLPDNYRVEACMGHVRDLPNSASEIPARYKKEAWAKEHGIDIEEQFRPLYVIPPTKKKVVSDLKAALEEAEALVIATDEDREGEAIGWHLTQVLKPKVPVRRMVFHEITKEAIKAAMGKERDINENLVRAQEVRRILDRLVGYSVSPILWIKIAPGLSAGRVQSVAVRLLVTRERQRRAFHKAKYWEVKAKLTKDNEAFEATLVRLGENRVATGRDFDENTGQLKAGSSAILLSEDDATSLAKRLLTDTWTVDSIEKKAKRLSPYPPFSTSTLQQEANRKLSLSSADTMQVAQRLYERGHITYMRTDSVNLSGEAIAAARRCIEDRYGENFLSKQPRQFTTKSKGAQEAHEAIRPAGTMMATSESLGLSGREKSLYDLIWKRTVATQMADAQQELISAQLKADDALFRATGKRILFAGFMRAYVEGTDDPNAALENREVPIPNLSEGDSPTVVGVESLARATRPPARYTEATLVQTLEKEGIGRPSTYATIIQTIQNRDYARKQSNRLLPTFMAFGVTQLMERHFERFVDTQFTAEMEETLDSVASGETQWLPTLEEFWTGSNGLSALVATSRDAINPREACTLEGFTDLPGRVRIGRYGPYIEVEQQGEDVLRISLPDELAPAELTTAVVEAMIVQKTEGPKSIAVDPDTNKAIYLLSGRYGPFIQLGEVEKGGDKPKRVSLPKGMKPEDITPETAISLINLPRTLGNHPEKKEPVIAGVGRYGPFVACQGEFRSLQKTDDVLTVELARALELLAQEKPGRRSSRTEPLRALGKHPDDDEPVNVMEGRYGVYVKHGSTNATLPKDVKPEEISLERAVELLAAKVAMGPSKKTRKRRGGKSTRA